MCVCVFFTRFYCRFFRAIDEFTRDAASTGEPLSLSLSLFSFGIFSLLSRSLPWLSIRENAALLSVGSAVLLKWVGRGRMASNRRIQSTTTRYSPSDRLIGQGPFSVGFSLFFFRPFVFRPVCWLSFCWFVAVLFVCWFFKSIESSADQSSAAPTSFHSFFLKFLCWFACYYCCLRRCSGYYRTWNSN